MPEYRFKKPFRKGGSSDRRRDDDGPKQLYTAECSNCHASCEVPFRPNGTKPVFCRNCFNRDRSEDERPGTRTFRPKTFTPRESFSPHPASKPDIRIDDLKRQLTNMEAKLDRLTTLLGERATAPVEKKVVTVKKVSPKKRAVKKA